MTVYREATSMRIAVASFILLSASLPGQAAVADYCAAFARDEANMRGPSAEPDWQLNYNNADAACMLRFTPATAGQVAAKAKKPAPKPKAKPLAPAQAAKASATAAISPLQEPKAVPKLEQGSAAWLAYCKKKYVSFSASKGTYTSKSGVERKCLVTPE
jgi:BA14K-like protein